MGVEVAALSAILRSVSNLAVSPVISEFKLLWNAEDEIGRLTRTASQIQRFLVDAEEKQHSEGSVEGWLRDLRDIAYDAEDVLDELATDALRRRVELSHTFWVGMVRLLFSCLTCSTPIPALFKYRITVRIKKVRERLEWIATEGRLLGIQEKMGRREGQPAQMWPERQTSSLVSGLDVVGRVKERELLVQLLLSDVTAEPKTTRFSAVSIVGMGGVGKTTLAQLAYNEEGVKDHFKLRIWVHVSHNFNAIRLINDLIESATGKRSDLRTLDALQTTLEKLLAGKRFLMVLDDVWDQRSLWEALRLPLSHCQMGSRVVITTRDDSNVDDVPSTNINLRALSFDECWSIFQKYASVRGTQLEMVGREIVKKARGIPLAAKALGGMVRSFGLNVHRWRDILEAEVWQLREDDVDIIPVLRLSYHHLPPHLKRCFAYCAIFPKGFLFDKCMLVQMWMALGFIQTHGLELLEDVASDCFDALLRRSFFQSAIGGRQYVMHDFMHDLAQSVSRDECFRIEDGCKLEADPRRVRHLSLSILDQQTLLYLHMLSKLRSLVFLSKDKSFSVYDLHSLFKKLETLRLLYLSCPIESSHCLFQIFKEVPDSLCSLKHLRYLHLSARNAVGLPESLGDLYNLQTLILEDCWKLRRLPKGMANLVNLRHLKVDADEKVCSLAGIGRLTSLQELNKFSVGREDGRKIGELRDLKELQGKLSLLKLENVTSGTETKDAKLDHKLKIDALDLEWTIRASVNLIDPDLAEEVLESLKPHSGLKHLVIRNYRGVRSPRWMQNLELPYLETVCLDGCPKWVVLPPLGQLQFLKVLEMKAMDGGGSTGCFTFYDNWNYKGTLFPSLRKLRIQSSLPLSQFPTLPPTLTELRIDTQGFSASMSISAGGSRSVSSSLTIYHSLDPTPRWEVLLLRHHLWALKELTISGYSTFEPWPIKLGSLLFLRKLSINNCPTLLALPPLPPSLTELNLWKVGLLALPEVWGSSSLSSLKKLEISLCLNLESLSEGLLSHGLRALTSLIIHDCIKLVYMPKEGFEALISLKSLDISSCPQLRELPPLPPSIRYLGLDRVGLSALPEFWVCNVIGSSTSSSLSICKLEITGCANLTILHQGLLGQDLRALEEVFICNCCDLVSLPGLAALVSLRVLTVARCPHLKELSRNNLPVSLDVFEVEDCPLLMEQYREEGGSYSPKVSHARIQNIDGRWRRDKSRLKSAEPSSISEKETLKSTRSVRSEVRQKILQNIFQDISSNCFKFSW